MFDGFVRRKRGAGGKLCAIAAGAGLLALGYGIARGQSAGGGVPLYYAGYLENADGTSPDGKRDLTVGIYANENGGGALCEMRSTETISGGRFRVRMADDRCRAVMKGRGELWVQLTVDQLPPLPRAPIGTVPYTIGAEHAESASRLTDTCRGCVTGTMIDAIPVAKLSGVLGVSQGGTGASERGGWQIAALTNGTNYAQGHAFAAYRKDPFGRVHLRGLIAAPKTRDAMFVLPKEFRPINGVEIFAALASASPRDAAVRVDVAPNGSVYVWGGDVDWVSLAGISFSTE